MAANESGIENRVMAILNSRRERAILEEDLRRQTQLSELSFRDALIRLTRKGRIKKWKTENYVNYIVAIEFMTEAYYEQEITITDALSRAFGAPPSVLIRRSIPFVVLDDEDDEKARFNRYRIA